MKNWILEQEFLNGYHDQIARVDLHFDNRNLIELLIQRANPVSTWESIQNYLFCGCFPQITAEGKI